jgi:tetratricopeptide (TPR) repeat protein
VFSLFQNGDDIADTLTKLGSVYQNHREYDLALLYHSRALNLRKSSQNINQRSIAINLLGLANAYWGLKNLSEALIYAQRALTINRSVQSDNNSHIVMNLAILANIYHHSGDDSHALIFAKQALTLLEHSPSSNSSLLVPLLNNIGTIQATVGLFDDARLTFIRLLHIYEEIFPEGHEKRVIIENNIKRITRTQGHNPMILFFRFSNILTKFLL